jgi:hypothetical protein
MIKSASLLLLLLALASLSACKTDHCDELEVGEGTCDGNRLIGCIRTPFSHMSFERDCGVQVCLNPEPGLAFCALQSELDPRCPSSSPLLVQLCSEGHELDCIDGYATFDEDCGAGLCYTPPPGPPGSPVEAPTCVFTPDVDPRCAAAPVPAGSSDPRRKTVCTATEVLVCVDDRVWGVAPCTGQGCTAASSPCPQ